MQVCLPLIIFHSIMGLEFHFPQHEPVGSFDRISPLSEQMRVYKDLQ